VKRPRTRGISLWGEWACLLLLFSLAAGLLSAIAGQVVRADAPSTQTRSSEGPASSPDPRSSTTPAAATGPRFAAPTDTAAQPPPHRPVLSEGQASPASDWPVPRAPADSLEPLRYTPQLLHCVPQDMLRDYPAVYLLYREQHTLRPDGKEVTLVQQLLRLNNRLAVEELSEQQIEFLSATQTLLLHVARLHTAEGMQLDLLPHQAHLRDANTDFKVYDQSRQLVLSFPARTPGDVLELQYSIIDADPQAAGHMFDTYVFGHESTPVAQEELVLCLPADRTLRYALRGAVLDPAVERTPERTVYRWRLNNTLPVGEEPHMPPAAELLPCLAYSTFASWEEVAEFNRRVQEDLPGLTPELEALVEQEAPPHLPPLQRVQRLAAWVRDRVRYLSANHEPRGYSPHPPAKVCADGYGDCKDKSQLLLEMLKHAQIPAALAYLNTDEQPQVCDDVPSPAANHVIVLVEAGGQPLWIDPTGSLGAWNMLAPSVCGRRAFVWDGQRIGLLTTPLLRAEENRVEQESELVIDAAGTGRWKMRRTYWGQEAWTARETMLAQSASQRRQALAAEFQSVYSQARLLEFKLEEPALSDPDQPLVLEAELEIAQMTEGDEGLLLQVANVLSQGLLAEDLSTPRRWPYLLDWPLEVRHRVSVVLPTAYVFQSLPESTEVPSQWGSSSLAVSAGPDPRRVELEWQLRLQATRVAPEDLPEFQTFAQQASELAVQFLFAAPSEDPADIPALVDAFSRNEADAATAHALAQLLISEERLEEAWQILSRAIAATPDDPALRELALRCAPSPQEALRVQRELAERWPEQGAYLLQLALALEEVEDMAAARQTLLRLAELPQPEWAVEAHYHLARHHLRTNELDKAAEELAAARNASPDAYRQHIDARLLEARLALHARRPHDALAVLQDAQPSDDEQKLEFAFLLAQAHRHVGQTEPAWQQLKRYLYLSSDDHDALRLVEVAELALALGQRSAALHAARRALEAQPDLHLARWFLVRAYHALGRYEQAVLAVDQDLLLLNADAARAVLESALRTGRLSVAREYVAQVDGTMLSGTSREGGTTLQRLVAAVAYCSRRYEALQQGLESPPPQRGPLAALEALACAEWLAGQGDWPAVESLVAQAHAAELQLPSLHALAGLVLLHAGRVREARQHAQAILHETNDPMACLLRGRLRYELQQEGAIEDLRRAAQLTDHQAPFVLHALAAALSAAGQHKEALALQRQAVELAPQDRRLRAQLVKLQAAAAASKRE